jgi:hypothetical protein
MNPALGFLRRCSLSSVEGLAVGRPVRWSRAGLKKTDEPDARVTSPIMVLELRGARDMRSSDRRRAEFDG